jgi:DHA1 family tetracycline resistance protein-like MFS transporter
MIGVAFGVGFIIGPVIGGILGQYSARLPFIAAGILTFINWLYGYFILPESLKPENRRAFDIKRANPIGTLKHIKKYPVILGLVLSLILVFTAHHAVQSNWTYYTMEKFKWDEAMVGYSLGVVGVLVAVVQGGLIRVINPKLGPKRSVYFGLVLSMIGFILFAFASKSWMMFAFLIPYCLGGIGGPAMQGIMSNQVPANEQGELQGVFASLQSATSILGPPLMTGIFAYYTNTLNGFYFPGAAFVLAGILTLLSLLFAMRSLASYMHKKN